MSKSCLSLRGKRLFRQLADTSDAHLENSLEFYFEEIDSDAEERVNEPDLLPLDPEKEERLRKMKMSSGYFLRKIKWERYTRVSVPYLEESEKEIFTYWIRPLDKEVCYGITSMRDDLKTAYMWMRQITRSLLKK